MLPPTSPDGLLSRAEEYRESLDRDSFAIVRGVLRESDIERMHEAIRLGLKAVAAEMMSAGILQESDVKRSCTIETGLSFLSKLHPTLRHINALFVGPEPVEPVAAALTSVRQHSLITTIAKSILGSHIVAHPQFALRAHLPSREDHCFPWHQDVFFLDLPAPEEARILNFWIPLMPVKRKGGCIEVIRGSHLAGPLPHRRQPPREDRVPLTEVAPEHFPGGPVVTIELEPGDALLMLDKTIHRSRINQSGCVRWSMDIRYCAANCPLGREGHSIEIV